MDKERSKRRMPNQIKPDFEAIFYKYITGCPTHGPRRISNELKIQGIIISETGVYHVLKRRDLNYRLIRLFYVQEHSDNPVIPECYLRKVEKKKETHILGLLSRLSLLPGYLLCGSHQGFRMYLPAGRY